MDRLHENSVSRCMRRNLEMLLNLGRENGGKAYWALKVVVAGVLLSFQQLMIKGRNNYGLVSLGVEAGYMKCTPTAIYTFTQFIEKENSS